MVVAIPSLNRSVVLGALAVVAGCLAGCATPGGGAPAAMKLASAYAAEASFQAPARDWPQDRWWTAYGDAQLDGLVEEGLKGSPTVAAAVARLDRARAQAAAAGAALAPSLSANASATELKQSYNAGIPPAFVPQGYQSTGRATVDLSWNLDLFGRNRAALAAATSEARAAEADAAQARLMLSTAIAEAYADLARLYAERDLAADAAKVRSQSATLVSDRKGQGLDTRASEAQAQARVPAALADQAALDEAIATTRNRIAALLGQGPDRGRAIARPRTVRLAAFGLPSQLAANLVGRRPDVVAARWRAEAAAKRVGVARAAFFPNINLVAYLGRQALPIDLFGRSGSDIGQVGPAISLPIFDGGRLRAGYRGARADDALAVAQYDDAVTEALRQVADVVAAEHGLGERQTQIKQSLAGNEEAFRLAQLRYRGGLSTYQSVLLAEDAVLQSRRAAADLDARAFTLDVQLIRALGGAPAPNADR